MSSLYDQFFSETNINHIYNVLTNIIQDELSYNIKLDNINLSIFENKMNQIFSNTQEITLDAVNKELA